MIPSFLRTLRSMKGQSRVLLLYLPLGEIKKELAQGQLVHVLPKWSLPILGVYAVWPDIGPQKALTRRLIEHFVEHRSELLL
ncbi:hypothetical protein [Ahrensia kielensis]|uniref:hypothetical protein n=1 Tax=Ahrensia kielensis TaxID=76980 RepID=UPI00146BC599|nr:hypothetical protein [Ahrensia kielensis]